MRTSTSSAPRPRRSWAPMTITSSLSRRPRDGPEREPRSRAARCGSTSCATGRSPTPRASGIRRSCSKRSADLLSRISVVIVTHDHREAVTRGLRALESQLRGGDELIVVDNNSGDGTPAAVRDAAPGATVIEAGANLGFGAGGNRGASAATGELLCFLNPDAVPAPGFRDAVERPLAEGRGWGAWQGLVTAEGGRVVNSRGGVVHFTGIAWAGGAGAPVGATE